MQPMEDDIDGETENYETLVAGLIKHIFGPGEEGVKKQLAQSQDLPADIGSMTFMLIDAASQQAKEAQVEIDLDMMLGAASEVIDSLLQIAEAMKLIESADDDDMREEAMMAAVNTYLTVGNPSPEDAEAAKQALAQFGDEDFAEAEEVVTRMGARRGEDPFADTELPPVDGAPAGGQPPGSAPMRGLMQAT